MPKLLIADDSLTTQKVVKLTFADEGIEVLGAEDGDTALQLVSKVHPDIVLADVNMPGLNGYEICEIIRKREESRSTPVVLLVGSFEPFDLEEARRVGATDYLTKPFSSIRKLVTTVFEHLNASKPGGQQTESAPAETKSPVEEPATDIDNLYNESFAETVELPPPSGPARGDFADAALDDELIETTYTSDGEAGTKQPWEMAEAGQTGSAETPEYSESRQEEEHEPSVAATEDHAQFREPIESSRGVNEASVEMEPSPFEAARDEAYFEPENDVAKQQQPALATVEPDQEFVDRAGAPQFEPEIATASGGEADRVDLPVTEPVGKTPALESEMPWNTIASSRETRFTFDEGNLLELPSSGKEAASQTPVKEPEAPPAATRQVLTPELMDRIVRTAAIRISEEFVRQIAERVVPQVVEEVLTESSTGEIDQ